MNQTLHEALRSLRSCHLIVPLLASSAFGQAVLNVSSLTNPVVKPNDQFDDTLGLSNALATLPNNTTLHFDLPGTYLLSGPMGTPSAPFPPALLTLNGKTNVGITAVAGVRLLLTGYDRSNTAGNYPDVLKVTNCNGFTLSGAGASSPLEFDIRGASTPTPGNEGLPFLQGTIVSVTSSTSGGPCRARVRITDPAMFLPAAGCQPATWGAWTFQGPMSPDVPPQPIHVQYGGTIVPVSAAGGTPPQQLVDLVFTPQPWVQTFASWTVGASLVSVLNQSDTYGVSIHQCTGTVSASHLVARHLPGKFFYAGHATNLVVDNVDVAPKLAGRLHSVNRDGVNAGGEHLEVRNCDLMRCGDDGLVAQGTSWGLVIPCSHDPAAMKFVLAPATTINQWPAYCSPGQLMVLVDKNTMSSGTLEYATIVSHPTAYKQPNGAVHLEYTYTNPSPGFGFLLSACLAPSRAFAYNPSYSLSGAVVEDCRVAGNRGIGIVVRSVFTQVARCEINNTHECGIHAGGGMVDAYPWWGAGAPPHLLTIEDCYLDRCGSSPHIATKGSIEIAVAQSELRNGPPWNPCLYYVNPIYPAATDVTLDVTLTRNVIKNFPRAGLFVANVGGANGIQVTNNSFQYSGSSDPCHPEHGYAVAVETCGSGLVGNNQYIDCKGKFWQHASPNVVFIP